jgi:RecA-family ATPase
MTPSKYDILGDVLPAIDPAALDYQQWVNVGFALKDGGFAAQDWEDWSRRDFRRYHPGECLKKWATIRASGVTLGTLIQYARDQGWTPPRQYREERALDWTDTIGAHGDLSVVDDPDQVEQHPLPMPGAAIGLTGWHPARELTRYLELLFSPDEIVGYVTEVWYSEDKAKYMPSKGNYSRTAGEIIADVAKHGDDLGAAIGDTKPEAGAWIRFNPLDGSGIRNENVTEYRYALVESDSMPVEQQYALYRAMELPARVLVHSGGKSLHAIVHIGAANYNEYRERVAYLYKVCEANGLKVDGQNKNPSRLSRMPGILRGEKKQYIVAENIGKATFEEWREYVESLNDDLPDPENLADVWGNMPQLSPPLIGGVLRQGHKLLLAGPSKAGKSFALLELCVAIAEGRDWLGFPCARGKVLYVNLELDRASCLNRLRDVYGKLGMKNQESGMKSSVPDSLKNIDIWNLRGSAVPMDKLAPKLIRRAQKKNYIAIIIDPIYKVITGDENSADQMARFCNQFDLICTSLGCAVIYCHHHSKGAQGQKSAMDRASGSGVFARDPDALLDMIELPVSEALKKAEHDRAACDICRRALAASRMALEPDDILSQDDACSAVRTLAACEWHLAGDEYRALLDALEAERARLDKRTAWRIEGTLREFAPFAPVNTWFDYPVHTPDRAGVLGDVKPEAEMKSWERGRQRLQENNRKQRDSALIDIRNAVDFSPTGSVAIRDLEILNKNGNPYSVDKISAWFGDGGSARPTYKKEFEKYLGDDGRAYLRRREDAEDTP